MKVFDRLGNGDYYIIKSGGCGGVSGQPLWAFLKSLLPKAATKYPPDNKEVLEATNLMEGWLSLFRYLIEEEAQGDARGPNPKLASFASWARQSAFKMPRRNNGSKRLRYGALGEEDAQDMPPIIMDLQDTLMGVQGELGVQSPSTSYFTPHGGFKILREDLRLLKDALSEQIKVMQVNNQSKIGALKFKTAQASARSQEVKQWMEQTQAIGGGAEAQRLQTEVVTLRSCCDFLEGRAFTQMAAFVTSLKDKVDAGVGFGVALALSPAVFVSRPELAMHMQEVKVTLDGFCQEMKGAPIEFGGNSFQGLDSCIAWACTHMPETTYQCIPGMFYSLCLIREAVLYKQDMRDDNIQAHRVQRSPMQSAVVESVNMAVPSILEGPKSSVLKDPKFNFGAMKTFAKWKPTNVQGGHPCTSRRASTQLGSRFGGPWTCFLGGSPVTKGVMFEMLAEYKILTSQLFITEITLYYNEILLKTGGNPPHSKEVKESCWALVTKLLRTILKEVHKVWRFTAKAVSISLDSLMTNGLFLYTALEELRVLREFSANDWQNHPKFNQNIVYHLFETCLPRAVYENKKEGSHILKINALTAMGKHHQALLNSLATGMGELRQKVGLPLAKKTKFAKGMLGGEAGIDVIK
jgi:hypothetical protein